MRFEPVSTAMAESAPTRGDESDRIAEDRSLLFAFHAGSEPAARELWNRYAGRLRVYARTLTHDELAEDVVQGVFLDVLRLRRGRIRAVRDPAAWLCTLTRHAALNARRGEARRENRELATIDARSEPTMDSFPSQDESTALLEQVPQPWREAVVLRHAYGFTFERLAEALGVSRSTAADRYSRGLAMARDLAEPTSTPSPKEHASHAR